MTQKSYYPSFQVMDEKDAWDDQTQAVVDKRLSHLMPLKFLTEHEANILSVTCSLLVNDSSQEVLPFVIHHIDQTLYASPGESQRKTGVPAGHYLIRQGLQAMDSSAQNYYSSPFVQLDNNSQHLLIQAISEGKAEPSNSWQGIPQQDFFRKLMSLTIESYCSHPIIWSEIGYAGPAYPRGYVRTQLGQLDPWEAKAKH